MSFLGKRTAKPGFRLLWALAADIFGKYGRVLNSLPYSAASVSHFYKDRSLPSLGMGGASVASSAVKCPQLPDVEGKGAALDAYQHMAGVSSSPYLSNIISTREQTVSPSSDPCVTGGNVSGWTALCRVYLPNVSHSGEVAHKD